MDPRPIRILSGAEIVDRGRNVTDCILPEVGTKEVTPNGSWLEMKQIQTALEARKALVAAERIDKVGALSHAEWRDRLKLAEVTQQVGGHWQYIGQNINGLLFLLPEEALFLIETNCLLLKHNKVTVSLQKAYSLLLDNQITLTKYKVYASLSRVGYKVFRHDKLTPAELMVNQSPETEMIIVKNEDINVSLAEIENRTNSEKVLDQPNVGDPNIGDSSIGDSNIVNPNIDDANIIDLNIIDQNMADPQIPTDYNEHNCDKTNNELPSDTIEIDQTVELLEPDCDVISKDTEMSEPTVTENDIPNVVSPKDVNGNKEIPDSETEVIDGNEPQPDSNAPAMDEQGIKSAVTEEMPAESDDIQMETVPSSIDPITTETGNEFETNLPKLVLKYQIMQRKIKSRKIPPSDPKSTQDRFRNLPDCYKSQVITVKVPCEDYLPRNVFLNNTTYVLNIQNCKKNKRRRKTMPSSVEKRAMLRAVRNSSESEMAAVPTPELPQFPPNTPMFQQPFGYFPTWRPHLHPRQQFNQHPFFYRMMHFMPQTFTTNRPRAYSGNINQRNRQYLIKHDHLRAIKNLANRLKQFNRPTNSSIRSLSGLVVRFNEIYNANVRVGSDFDVLDDEVVETIELDDDDDVDVETEARQPENANYQKYLFSVKYLAAQLKTLERKNRINPKQKKAFAKLLQNFNKTYNTDFQIDSNGALVDKKLVILDSSSDSDVVEAEFIEPYKKKRRSNSKDKNASQSKRRKLLNPFSVMKKVNEGASTSVITENIIPDAEPEPVKNNSDLLKYFDKNWLPDDDDFGTAMLNHKTDALYLWNDSEQFYDFISWVDCNTWADLKLSFCSHMEAISNFEDDLSAHSQDMATEDTKLKAILVEEPAADWASALEKLRIIKTDTEVEETSLTIDFDVYNRDVQNFRKTDPPKPHFRVVCVDESSKFPSGAQIKALHSRCDDNVTTVFAVISEGSITYLQMNPKELPVYVGSD